MEEGGIVMTVYGAIIAMVVGAFGVLLWVSACGYQNPLASTPAQATSVCVFSIPPVDPAEVGFAVIFAAVGLLAAGFGIFGGGGGGGGGDDAV